MGIPFLRDEGLCTQFATEIILRRGLTNTLTIRVIPDETRSQKEKESIKAFFKSITDFDELLWIMKLAKDTMGITPEDGGNVSAST